MIEQYPVPQPEKDDDIEPYHDPVESCAHDYEVRRMFCADGSIQFRKQCTQCGKGLPALARSSLTIQERDQSPPFDRELEQNVRHVAWEQRQTAGGDRRARWFKWYNPNASKFYK